MLPNIFWSRTDKISGAYATKMVAISSPGYSPTLKQRFTNGSSPPSCMAQYGMQLCPFPLSEVVNGAKIAKRTAPLFLVSFRWGT